MVCRSAKVAFSLLLAACSGGARDEAPPAEELADEPSAEAPSDPEIVAPIALDLVIAGRPAASAVHARAEACEELGAASGPARDGVAEEVAIGPAGAIALYPSERLDDDYSTATVLLLGSDGERRPAAELTIRGLLTRVEPLEDGFLVVTRHDDFSDGLVARFHAYVVDGRGRFGGHLEVTAEGRSQLDGVGGGEAGVLRFFYAPNPSMGTDMVVVEVRRGEGGALERSDFSVPVHQVASGAPGRSLVVAIPPASSATALVLHPDGAPELLRAEAVTRAAGLEALRGSWALGTPVRVVATEDGARVHALGSVRRVFAVGAEGLGPVDEPLEPPVVDSGDAPQVVALGDVLSGNVRAREQAQVAWSGTTMARLEGQRLAVLRCAR